MTRGGHRIVADRADARAPADARARAGHLRARRACSTGSSRSPTRANMLASRLAARAGRRRGAARHPARPRARVPDRRRSSSCATARSGRRRSSDHVLDSITRRVVLAVRGRARGADRARRRSRDAQEAFIASTRPRGRRRAPRRRAPLRRARAAHARDRRARARADRVRAALMRIATVVGNRPQFVKAAAVSGPLRERHEEILIHTGQHHDDELSAVFFEELGTPGARPRLGDRRRLQQLAARADDRRARAAARRRSRPSRARSTATPTRRSPARSRRPTAARRSIHVEAGMRSFDRRQPEERNRVLTDQLSALLLCSTQAAAEQLAARGGARARGRRRRRDGRRRAARRASGRSRAREPLERFGAEPGGYVLATAHRAANVDDAAALERLVALLEAVERADRAAASTRAPLRGSRATASMPGRRTPPR